MEFNLIENLVTGFSAAGTLQNVGFALVGWGVEGEVGALENGRCHFVTFRVNGTSIKWVFPLTHP